MSITVINQSENNGELTFTLSGVDVSVANAIRRTILSDIPIVVFKTFGEHSDANFTTNTCRLNNEILSQRLSCIPIHISADDDEYKIDDLLVELNERNDSDTMRTITTADFKIKTISTGEYLSKEKCTEIFKPFISPTGESYFIQFTRLRPRISPEIPGEAIEMTCKFSVGSAAENSMLNVVGTCAYGMTVDADAAEVALINAQKKWQSEGLSHEMIERNSINWGFLEKKRITRPNSFDFIIATVGQLSNSEIVGISCNILVNKFKNISQLITDGLMLSNANSEKTIEYILENEDYTVGTVITNLMFNKYIAKKTAGSGAKLAFCGFKKLHPHDTQSIIRIIFDERESDSSSSNASPGFAPSTESSADKEEGENAFRSIGLNYIKKCCNDAIEIFEAIGQLFMR